MDHTEKMDCRSNAEVIFTGAISNFQLRMGLTQQHKQNKLKKC